MIQKDINQENQESNAVDALLKTKNTSREDLIIANLLNQGFLRVFNGEYEKGFNYFRQIQTIKPGNIVAANNMSTCKIFLNKTNDSIKLLEDLMKKDQLNSINDQMVLNLVNMYDIHFPNNTAEKRSILAEFCSKYSKDTVNANIYLKQKS